MTFKPYTPPPRRPGDDDIAIEGNDSFPTVEKVCPAGQSAIYVCWSTGQQDRVNLRGLIGGRPAWAPLAAPETFEKVTVVGNGHGVGWPGDLDISSEALATMAEIQRGWSGDDFAAWMDRMGLSFRSAAEALAVAPSTIHEQRRREQIDRVMMLAARALEADGIAFDAVNRPPRRGRPRAHSISDLTPIRFTDTRFSLDDPEEQAVFGYLIAPSGRLHLCANKVRISPAPHKGTDTFGLAYWHRTDKGFWRQAHVDYAPVPAAHHQKMMNYLPEIARCQLLLIYPLFGDAASWKANAIAASGQVDIADLPERKDALWIEKHFHKSIAPVETARINRDAAIGDTINAQLMELEIRAARHKGRVLDI